MVKYYDNLNDNSKLEMQGREKAFKLGPRLISRIYWGREGDCMYRRMEESVNRENSGKHILSWPNYNLKFLFLFF